MKSIVNDRICKWTCEFDSHQWWVVLDTWCFKPCGCLIAGRWFSQNKANTTIKYCWKWR